MLAEDGYFYMYQTDAGFGDQYAGHGHFHCRRSRNLVDWEYLDGTMPELPAWIPTKLNEIRAAMGLGTSTTDYNKCGYWAPCVRKVRNGLYRMYYVITIDGFIDGPNTWGERAFIGLMETATPANVNSWVDKGFVITNYSDKNLNFRVKPDDWQNCYYRFNAIDPSYFIDPNDGRHWLAYGSWHSGFALVEINPETGKTVVDPLPNPWGAANAAAYGKRIATRAASNRWQGSEAPELIYHDGYYYLFMAYDGLDVPYNTRVVRSKNVEGPYVGINGANVTNGADAYPIMTHPYKFSGNQGWVGISHCAVFDDGNGNWYYASQQRFPADMDTWAPNAVMMGGVRSILWTSSGWPVVMPERYAAVPQVPISDADIVGAWEHIDLSYKYGEMKESGTMVFGEDHKISSGPWKGGAWSFDPSTNTLTANGVELKVQRECDWESSPRHHTIVYAGLNGQKTYWGKKR
jgi:beta-xylosidase